MCVCVCVFVDIDMECFILRVVRRFELTVGILEFGVVSIFSLEVVFYHALLCSRCIFAYLVKCVLDPSN